MFTVAVGKVVGCFAPVDAELILAHTIMDPVETHVHGFVMVLFDSVVDGIGRKPSSGSAAVVGANANRNRRVKTRYVEVCLGLSHLVVLICNQN